MCQGLRFLHVVIGHQCQQLVFVGPAECPGAVGPRVARDDSLGIGERQHHLVDDRRLDLVPEVVVGDMEIGGETDLVETRVEDHASTDAVCVEVWHDGDLFVGRVQDLQRHDHLIDVFEQRMLSIVDLLQVLIGPSHPFTDTVEQF